MDNSFLTGGAVNLSRLLSSESEQLSQKANLAKQSIEAAKATGGAQNKEELREACQKFESLFLGYLLKEMRKTVQKSGLFPESMGQKIYTSMLDDEVAKVACQSGGMGLGDLVFSSLVNEEEDRSEQTEKELASKSIKELDLNNRYEHR